MAEPMTYRTVAGLSVPLPLIPRIVEAFRGSYPSICAELDDETAVKACLKHIVAVTVASWEARKATEGMENKIERLREEGRMQANDAHQRALDAVDLLIGYADTPDPTDPMPTPPAAG